GQTWCRRGRHQPILVHGTPAVVDPRHGRDLVVSLSRFASGRARAANDIGDVIGQVFRCAPRQPDSDDHALVVASSEPDHERPIPTAFPRAGRPPVNLDDHIITIRPMVEATTMGCSRSRQVTHKA
ncbi:MAG: hypothetical protein ACP5P1_09005, partial [Acidimicrobiales bacterium]